MKAHDEASDALDDAIALCSDLVALEQEMSSVFRLRKHLSNRTSSILCRVNDAIDALSIVSTQLLYTREHVAQHISLDAARNAVFSLDVDAAR